jgi:hypothetical protein
MYLDSTVYSDSSALKLGLLIIPASFSGYITVGVIPLELYALFPRKSKFPTAAIYATEKKEIALRRQELRPRHGQVVRLRLEFLRR